jgi:hypothetical protein
MLELLKLIKDTPVSLVILALVMAITAYFARNFFEGWLKSRFATQESLLKNHYTNLENLVKSSLSIKEELRSKEQTELVEFRVSVEKWEYFLQTGISDLTMMSESNEFEPAGFHKRDTELFGGVRIAAVKASIYLREQELEVELLKTIGTIRDMYYPLLYSTIQRVLELQSQLLPYLTRIKQFEVGGFKDNAVALSPDEGRIVVELRHKMTNELRAYAEGLVAQYKPIAEQLWDLKHRINVHIYRPLTTHEIDKV